MHDDEYRREMARDDRAEVLLRARDLLRSARRLEPHYPDLALVNRSIGEDCLRRSRALRHEITRPRQAGLGSA